MLLTALNLEPSMAMSSLLYRSSFKHSLTKAEKTFLIALELFLRKSAIVRKSGVIRLIRIVFRYFSVYMIDEMWKGLIPTARLL